LQRNRSNCTCNNFDGGCRIAVATALTSIAIAIILNAIATIIISVATIVISAAPGINAKGYLKNNKILRLF
jgi:hypothetical protein